MKNVLVIFTLIVTSTQAMASSYYCSATKMHKNEMMKMGFMLTEKEGDFLYIGSMDSGENYFESGMLIRDHSIATKAGFSLFKGMVKYTAQFPEMIFPAMMAEKEILISREVLNGMMSGKAFMNQMPYLCTKMLKM